MRLSVHELSIALPADYRSQDVLAFHGRDAQQLAEQVTPGRVRKGVLLHGVPLVLDVALAPGVARCRIEADEALDDIALAAAREALLNILALRIDPAPFALFTHGDPLLGPFVTRQPNLRIVQSATVFEALTWAIIGQQINLAFAISLRRTFIEQAGRRHSSGLWCYPEAVDAARLDLEALTTRKFSRAKAETVLRLARLVADGELVLDRSHGPDEVASALLAVKGIGPWTVNYTLLRGYGFPDCSLHGDVAVRAAFQHLLGEDSKPDMARTETLLERYKPHRAMAAAYLWASLNQNGGN
ncbi:DNA-3-methyladenine glycosylase family protein [Massilia horti]|uniref:DNA-3-methyladenine glycosylase II n=1 Tax=Massilia horti TaxID=2562153 RepID=A0A4Y9SVK9_9BURK|nr:DNA-3-methyladenine glycosylase 2 [Massilia horti]TFW30468.1 DNA-3-methyladenine glycosylase 2 [Massilia horti]TFW30613.1 DNA-3-methyladenine glycosylase 2 [Massilia horti]